MINRLSPGRLARNLFFYYLPFLILGWFVDQIVLLLLIASVALLAWNYWHIHQLNNWLWTKRSLIPPQSSGQWGTLFDGIFAQQKKNRKRRKALGELIKRFREGSEAMPDSAVVFKDDYRIVWCNKLAQRSLGLQWPEDAGNRIDNLVRHPLFIQYLVQKEFNEPFNLTSPVSADIFLEFRVMPYSQDQYLLIARDVTRIKNLEQTRKNFITNVSHELRTPLTVIQGYLEMTKDPDIPKTMYDKAHQMMTAQARRMEALTQQLLTLSRIESGSGSDHSKTVNVANMLSGIANEARVLSGESAHDIQLFIDEGLGLKGNEQELQSAFSNLIFNAVRHTPPKTRIDVHWRRLDSESEFAVTDHGEGIPPQHLARLTERFYRVDKARTRDNGGSGLGLSIVKHALSHHQSELSISSRPGQGATFRCQFPTDILVDLNVPEQQSCH